MMIDIETLISLGAVSKQVSAGEMLFLEEGSAHFYNQLISGRVRCVNITDEGKEFTQMIIQPGECFGELALIDDQPYAVTAIADTDAVYLRLNGDAFRQLLKEDTELHLAFTQLLCRRLRFKYLLSKEQANQNPRHSILNLLNYFKQTKQNVCSQCSKVMLTRQQIADMTGLRVETVIRAIRQLEEQGVLWINNGKVYLSSYDCAHRK
ncbi:Crp/Fnr family transcriptional regulator [Chitinophaga tropicalis]|nr:Crp/Fnr family transcriptional regulator [Chitinophaga tropicalis]